MSVGRSKERIDIEMVEIDLQVTSKASRRKGFGTDLVEQGECYELTGISRLEIFSVGCQATICVPLRQGDSILRTDARAVSP